MFLKVWFLGNLENKIGKKSYYPINNITFKLTRLLKNLLYGFGACLWILSDDPDQVLDMKQSLTKTSQFGRLFPSRIGRGHHIDDIDLGVDWIVTGIVETGGGEDFDAFVGKDRIGTE